MSTVETQIAALGNDLDTFWTFFGTTLVFWMHAGFSILEAGSIRAKNVQNILFKNLIVVTLTTILWWFWGYAFAFGTDYTKGFIGGGTYHAYTVSRLSTSSWAHWLFQWAFAATAITIISGAMAERIHMGCFLVLVFTFNTIVYPPVAHWVWDSNGWLNKRGFLDFAGSAVVHTVGGIAALVGSFMIGRRRGIMGNSSIPLVVLGTFILWMGWFGFNGASSSIYNKSAVVSRVLVNTTIASSTSGLFTVLLTYFQTKKLLVDQFCNGILAGLVSITANCDGVEDWAAFIIGLIGALVYVGAVWLLTKFNIDDAIYASAVHGFCGIWGILATGLFNMSTGWFYNKTTCMGWQCIGIIVITVWAAFWTFVICFVCQKIGILKYSDQVQDEGIDIHHHIEKSSFKDRMSVVRQTGAMTSTSSSDKRVTQLKDLA